MYNNLWPKYNNQLMKHFTKLNKNLSENLAACRPDKDDCYNGR